MMIEKTYKITWAYGETSFINARDEEHAKRIASTMGFAYGLGRVISVAQTETLPSSEVDNHGWAEK
tara:strand:- start:468 stop:665 length:198 start_codon:yes stop_codon:yes gene_type:complete